jgi:photosystem II stability/assembly factor-like uncharacterized protein
MRACALGLTVLALAVAAPASAQWGRVEEIPSTRIFTVATDGETIAAGADTAVYVSTDAGKTWRRSTKPVTGVTSIQALTIREGRLYAGTFGQGVHVSDDLGATWHPFNEGLVGGFLDSQLDLTDLQLRGDFLYASTAGASVYVRSLTAGGWQPFGVVFEDNQDANVDGLALGEGRLLALAGSNGQVYFNDPGATDWTQSHLNNVGIRSGVHAQAAAWTGTGWVVGTNVGMFRSAAGQEPWTRLDLRLGSLIWTALTTQGHHLFAAFDTPLAAVLAESVDDGASWQIVETQPNVFVQKLAISGGSLYAARADGLWRRPFTVTGVVPDAGASRLKFAMAGAQPFGNRTSLRFELARAERISIEIFDVQGRRVGDRFEGQFSKGPHEMPVDANRLGSGVYFARLTAGGEHRVVRMVHVR